MAIGYAYAGMAGLQLAGGLLKADAIKRNAQLNQDIANMNAEFAELDAYDAELEGWNNQARYQKIIDETLATQQLNLTASDIDVSYGSASSIQDETRFMGEINKLEIQNQADQAALGYRNQARQYRLGGFLGNLQASVAAQSAQFQGITSALNTGLSGYKAGAYSNMGPSRSNNDYTYKRGGSRSSYNYTGGSSDIA